MEGAKSVFISYSSKDEQFVSRIVNVLKEMEISFWKAPEMIPAGSSYAKEIPCAIKECEVFLLVLSKASQTSIWVEKELDSAINNRKIIVPIKIDDEPLGDIFQFYLNNVQTISYKEDSVQKFFGFKERMKKLLYLEEMEKETSQDIEEGFAGNNMRNQKKKLHTVAEQSDSEKTNSDRRADAFVINKAPSECQYCGGELEEIGVGIFKCLQCGKENYDYLRTVRNYLEKEGAQPATIITKATGVPRKAVDHFLRQEFLEIPKLAPERLSCQKCGAPIRTGCLCESCKSAEKRCGKKSLRGKWYTGY